MNDVVRTRPHGAAASRQDQFASAAVARPVADGESGRQHSTLWGEYGGMLLAMNSGFSALVWILRMPQSAAAGGFAAACLWTGLRSMGVPRWSTPVVPLSGAVAVLCGGLTFNTWGESPTWLMWSPFSPLAVSLMAAAVTGRTTTKDHPHGRHDGEVTRRYR